MTGPRHVLRNQNSTNESFKDPMFEILDTGHWICNNCSTIFPADESIGRHLFTCLKLAERSRQLRISTSSSPQMPLAEDNQNIMSDYCCKYCSRPFHQPVLLRRHESQCTSRNRSMDFSEGSTSFKCHRCSKSYCSKKSLDCHLKLNKCSVGTDSIPLKQENQVLTSLNGTCTNSGERFTEPIHVSQNVQTDRGQRYTCRKCFKKFNTRSKLWHHERTHEEDSVKIHKEEPPEVHKEESPKLQKKKTFKCKHCDKVFRYNYNLSRHQIVHSNLNLTPFKCDVCMATFKQLWCLNAHRRTHTRDGAYACKICKARFNSGRHFAIHYRTVHPNISLKCNGCHRQFKFMDSLVKHERRTGHDTGKKPDLIQCTRCGAVFTQVGNLKRHLARVHRPGSEPPVGKGKKGETLKFKCNICVKQFSYHSVLKIHLKQHSRSHPHGCTICGARFEYQSGLNRHACKLKFGCSFCSARFAHKLTRAWHEHKHRHGKLEQK